MRRNRQSNPSQSARGGTLIGMFVGLVLGVCLAAGVVWYTHRSNSPFTRNNVPATSQANPPAKTNGGQTQPLPIPGKPGDPAPDRRFQFYDILPGKSEAVPDGKPNGVRRDETASAKPQEDKKDERGEELKQPIVLQAGSFTVAQDADNQKARLALMGIEANVQQVMVQDKIYYRVRLGPYARMDEANKVRSELTKSGIEVALVKKEP